MTEEKIKQKAEEYQIKKHHKRLFGSKPVVMQELKKTFIDGYHECQKEHEWHKVADGDYPKEKGNYLVAWERTHHVEEYGKWGFDVDLFNADEGYFEGVGDYVIAWKEIVLPKEIE